MYFPKGWEGKESNVPFASVGKECNYELMAANRKGGPVNQKAVRTVFKARWN